MSIVKSSQHLPPEVAEQPLFKILTSIIDESTSDNYDQHLHKVINKWEVEYSDLITLSFELGAEFLLSWIEESRRPVFAKLISSLYNLKGLELGLKLLANLVNAQVDVIDFDQVNRAENLDLIINAFYKVDSDTLNIQPCEVIVNINLGDHTSSILKRRGSAEILLYQLFRYFLWSCAKLKLIRVLINPRDTLSEFTESYFTQQAREILPKSCISPINFYNDDRIPINQICCPKFYESIPLLITFEDYVIGVQYGGDSKYSGTQLQFYGNYFEASNYADNLVKYGVDTQYVDSGIQVSYGSSDLNKYGASLNYRDKDGFISEGVDDANRYGSTSSYGGIPIVDEVYATPSRVYREFGEGYQYSSGLEGIPKPDKELENYQYGVNEYYKSESNQVYGELNLGEDHCCISGAELEHYLSEHYSDNELGEGSTYGIDLGIYETEALNYDNSTWNYGKSGNRYGVRKDYGLRCNTDIGILGWVDFKKYSSIGMRYSDHTLNQYGRLVESEYRKRLTMAGKSYPKKYNTQSRRWEFDLTQPYLDKVHNNTIPNFVDYGVEVEMVE